jgi:hypothetical protein
MIIPEKTYEDLRLSDPEQFNLITEYLYFVTQKIIENDLSFLTVEDGLIPRKIGNEKILELVIDHLDKGYLLIERNKFERKLDLLVWCDKCKKYEKIANSLKEFEFYF